MGSCLLVFGVFKSRDCFLQIGFRKPFFQTLAPTTRHMANHKIFERKTSWRLGTLDDHQHCKSQANYSSVRDHVAQVEAQFEDVAKQGFMEVMTLEAALRRFGDRFSLTAIGSIAKNRGAGAIVRNCGCPLRGSILLSLCSLCNILR